MCLVMACVTLSVPTKRVCRMRSTVDQCSPPVLSGEVRWGSRTDWVRRMPRACVKMAQLMSHSVVPCEHRCTSCCSHSLRSVRSYCVRRSRNNFCDEACNIESCRFDGGDCTSTKDFVSITETLPGTRGCLLSLILPLGP